MWYVILYLFLVYYIIVCYIKGCVYIYIVLFLLLLLLFLSLFVSLLYTVVMDVITCCYYSCCYCGYWYHFCIIILCRLYYWIDCIDCIHCIDWMDGCMDRWGWNIWLLSQWHTTGTPSNHPRQETQQSLTTKIVDRKGCPGWSRWFFPLCLTCATLHSFFYPLVNWQKTMEHHHF